MATLRNKKKLAALNKENCEEHPRNNMAQNSNVPRSQEDYVTQVSEEIEGRVTKLSQKFNRAQNRILRALACLDDFLMNPLLQGLSGTAPETSRNALSTSQGTNEDDSQNEAGIFQNQVTQNSGPEDGHDSMFPVFVLSWCEVGKGLLWLFLIIKLTFSKSIGYIPSHYQDFTWKFQIFRRRWRKIPRASFFLR